MRAGLRALLGATAAAEDVLQIVYEAASLEDVEYLFPIDMVDVVIMTSEVSGPALKRLLVESKNPPALLALADQGELVQELTGIPARAWGVLPLDASAEELIAAVHAVHQGLLVGAPALVEPSLTQLLSNKSEGYDHLIETLTERESQVLELLTRGLANKQIALELGISEHTVKFHVSSIYTKLNVTNRAEAVRTGIQQGLVSL
jgi:DNA-binding NarL/FixJ family response regulator